jgi:prevent-host-death family protein
VGPRREHAPVPEDRQGGTPAQAAEGLKPYLDAGFSGFTFNNTLYRTAEQIGLVGEVLTELRRHFGRVLREVQSGATFTIIRRGRPVARLVPASPPETVA